MPSYDFKCGVCDHVVEDKILRITHTAADLPLCCDRTMGYHITQAPSVVWTDPVIEPFRNPAAKRGDKDAVISSTRQRKEFMAKNNLVDGNDFKPVTSKESKQEQDEMRRSIAAITPTDEIKSDMEKRGMMDILPQE